MSAWCRNRMRATSTNDTPNNDGSGCPIDERKQDDASERTRRK